jgi:ComF family protein
MTLLRIILDLLFPPRSDEALVNDATSESIGVHARPKAVTENVTALLPYRARLVRACVLEAKFRDSDRAQRLLAGVLADHLREWVADRADLEPGLVFVVPVPLSREREKERGYNQAERIARKALGNLPEIRLETGLLARVRDTLPQTSLDGAGRRENVQGAFGILRDPDPLHTYIVLDDVFTTGSTLEAAMTALGDAGAARIYGLALAH